MISRFHPSTVTGLFFAAVFTFSIGLTTPAAAQQTSQTQYSRDELVRTGHGFFGEISNGLAKLIERAVAEHGLPNAYILGEEAGGAIVAGVRYGGGTLYTRNDSENKIYWQGPSLGFDMGVDGAKTMMLVYNLPRARAMYKRYAGVNGSAYVIGGFGMTVLKRRDVVVVPVRAGVGARLGINVGYLHFTRRQKLLPF